MIWQYAPEASPPPAFSRQGWFLEPEGKEMVTQGCHVTGPHAP